MKNKTSNIIIDREEVKVIAVTPGLGENSKKDSAQVSQIHTHTYPAVQAGSSLSSGLFPSALFGKGQSYEKNYTAFVDVPAGYSVDQAQAQLDNFPEACVYKIFSYNVLDVMTETQIEAMENGFSKKDIAFYENKYFVPMEDGTPVIEDGHTLYSSAHFMDSDMKDVNLREASIAANGERVSIAEAVETKVTEVSPINAEM